MGNPRGTGLAATSPRACRNAYSPETLDSRRRTVRAETPTRPPATACSRCAAPPVYCAVTNADPQVVERIGLRSCTRRGAAITLVAERGRENRSQLVFTQARGRDAVFWQSPKTRKAARPNVRLPTARAAGLAGLEIVVDSHEQYPYRFAGQQVSTVRRALPAGDYGVVLSGRLVAAVERKSLPDLVSSLTSGKLGYQLADLASLPRAAVVVEDRYSQLFKQDRVRPAVVADGLAELAVRWPGVPIVFCETRALAEEWTYRYLAAAYQWASSEDAAATRIGVPVGEIGTAPAAGGSAAAGPSAAEVRAWARANNLPVADRGRLPPEVWALARRPLTANASR